MKRKGILAWVLCVCTSGLCAQGRVSGNLLEELMEKLPGKVIVEDGTVKINGKQVERIIVDGKEISVPCNKERQINDISYLSVKAGTGENEGAN